MSVSFTLTSLRFPNGTTVKAYPTSNWPTPGEPSGAPVGSAAAEGTVSSGTLTLTGLEQSKKYWAVAEVGGAYRYVKFIAGEDVAESASALHTSDLDTDATLAADSDSKVSSQKAVKGYVDTASGLLLPKAASSGLHPLNNTGFWIPQETGLSTGAPTAARLYYRPVYNVEAFTVDKLALEVTAGVTSTCWVGIYNVNQATGQPTTRIFRKEFTGTAAALKELTGIATSIPAGLIGIVTLSITGAPTFRTTATRNQYLSLTAAQQALGESAGVYLTGQSELASDLSGTVWSGAVASAPLVAFKKE